MHWIKAWCARSLALALVSLTGLPGAGAQTRDPDELAWDAARRDGSYEAYQRYLEEFPVGRYAGEAFRQMVEQSLGVEESPSFDVRQMY